MEKICFRSQILEGSSIGKYWNIFGVPVLPKNLILRLLYSVVQKYTGILTKFYSPIAFDEKVTFFGFNGPGHACVSQRGVLKFRFGRDMQPVNLKVDPYKNYFSRKTDPFIHQLAKF